MINDGPMMMPIMPGTPQHNDNESIGQSSNENNQPLLSDRGRGEMKKNQTGPQDFKKAYLKVRFCSHTKVVAQQRVIFQSNSTLLIVQLVQDMAQKEGQIAVSDVELRELNNQVSAESDIIRNYIYIYLSNSVVNCVSVIEAFIEPIDRSSSIRQICCIRARACSQN